MALYLVGGIVLGAVAIVTTVMLLLTLVSTPGWTVGSAVGAAVVLGSGIGSAKCIERLRSFFRHVGWLTLHADGIRFVDLDGSTRADTLTQTLSITRTNYTRRTKWESYVRPGFDVRCPSGTWLLGSLSPRPPWEDAPRTEELPGDDLAADVFGALDDAVVRLRGPLPPERLRDP